MAHIDGEIVVNAGDLNGRLHAHAWRAKAGYDALVIHLPGNVRITADGLTPEQLIEFLDQVVAEARTGLAALRAQHPIEDGGGSDA